MGFGGAEVLPRAPERDVISRDNSRPEVKSVQGAPRLSGRAARWFRALDKAGFCRTDQNLPPDPVLRASAFSCRTVQAKSLFV